LGAGLSLAGLTRESNVLLLLNDSFGKQHRCQVLCLVPPLTVLLSAELLITELALASRAIPSLTLSSPSLLSPVLETNSPTAIIVDGNSFPHLLELIYELHEFVHHFVIVVGEADDKLVSKASRRIKLALWTDIEAQGKAAEPIPSPALSNSHLCQLD
jgi:long-chain acyl-CoA synthetase